MAAVHAHAELNLGEHDRVVGAAAADASLSGQSALVAVGVGVAAYAAVVMRRSARFGLGFVLLFTACTRPAPPWQRDSFVGEFTLHGPRVSWRGRVTFHRPLGEGTGTLQVDTRGQAADNVTLLPSGQVSAFRDGVPRAPSADERSALDLLAVLFAWPGREGGREGVFPDFTVRAPDEHRVTLTEEQAKPSPHPR